MLVKYIYFVQIVQMKICGVVVLHLCLLGVLCLIPEIVKILKKLCKVNVRSKRAVGIRAGLVRSGWAWFHRPCGVYNL